MLTVICWKQYTDFHEEVVEAIGEIIIRVAPARMSLIIRRDWNGRKDNPT